MATSATFKIQIECHVTNYISPSEILNYWNGGYYCSFVETGSNSVKRNTVSSSTNDNRHLLSSSMSLETRKIPTISKTKAPRIRSPAFLLAETLAAILVSVVAACVGGYERPDCVTLVVINRRTWKGIHRMFFSCAYREQVRDPHYARTPLRLWCCRCVTGASKPV